MEYQYRDGRKTYRGVDAEVAGPELDRIRRANGGLLRTEDTWRDAQRLDSPLHGAFTWDLKEAAEKCWDAEARYLIRYVLVRPEPETRDGKQFEFRPLFLHVREEPTLAAKQAVAVNYYQHREIIVKTELDRAMEQLNKQLSALVRAIEDVRTLMGGTDDRLELLVTARDSVAVAQAALSGVI